MLRLNSTDGDFIYLHFLFFFYYSRGFPGVEHLASLAENFLTFFSLHSRDQGKKARVDSMLDRDLILVYLLK